MRIDSSNVMMESSRSYASTTKRTSVFASYTLGGALTKKEGYLNFNNLLQDKDKQGEVQGEEDSFLSLQNRFRSVTGLTKISNRNEMEMLNKIRQQCIQYLISLFYPKRRSGMEEDSSADKGGMEYLSGTNAANPNEGMATTTLTLGNITYSYMEEESTSFQTQGTVITADGRKIDFGMELGMSRSFATYYQENFESLSTNLCDPLVINLDGNIAGLSDQKFVFDIDGDGILDQVSQLNAGSGYLALDKNGDGIINDGNELFGPQSGNGFGDLAKYDSDGNGWIDEGDEIWEKLLIWTKDENGKDQLYHLSEKGVGAICLQNAATDFSLNSMEDNRTNGIIRSTGIFLYENGNVGTVQHLDVAK